MNIQATEVLELLKTQWDSIPKEYKLVVYLAGTVFAFLNCFMGYRLRKVWGCVLGILAGGGGGAAAGYYFLHDRVMAIVCGLAGALILGLLAWLLYKFGVFVMCGGLFYAAVMTFFDNASVTQHVIVLVIGVFIGTLALGYEKQMVIGITALCGGIGGIHLLMLMTGKDAGMGELLLGIILAAIGAVVQAMPFMRGREAEGGLFGGRRGRRKGSVLPGRRKKVVKKKNVTHVNKGKSQGNRNTSGKKKYDKREYDPEDYEEDEEEEYPKGRSDLDKTQEYRVGEKQYEEKKPQVPYMAPGIGIDLDDLNRELSQEIKKIYKDEE